MIRISPLLGLHTILYKFAFLSGVFSVLGHGLSSAAFRYYPVLPECVGNAVHLACEAAQLQWLRTVGCRNVRRLAAVNLSGCQANWL